MSYDTVCAHEEADLLKRWAPYVKGTPSNKLSYYNEYDRANILFFTDSHIDFHNIDACIENVHRTADFIKTTPIPLDAVVHGGDAITPFDVHDKNDFFNRAGSFFDVMKQCDVPFLFTKGNHDINDWRNYPEHVPTDDDWGKVFLNHTEEKYGIVRQTKASGSKSTWHYYDIEKHKIRIIALDGQDTDKITPNEKGMVKYFGGNSWYISNEQMNWVTHTALNFDDKPEKDWGVIVTIHQHHADSELHENAADRMLKICEAFNVGGTCDITYTHGENSFFDLDVHADFTRYKDLEQKPHMICWLIGHNHTDKNEFSYGINLIWTLNASTCMVASDARVARTPGTPTQNAFDIVNIDTKQRKIRLFRYGAGVTCYGGEKDRFLPDGLDY